MPIKKLKTESPITNTDTKKAEQHHNSRPKEVKICPNNEVKILKVYEVTIKKFNKKAKKSSLKLFSKLVVVTRPMEKKSASYPSSKEI